MVDATNIPAPRVPFIDERTGLMSREWYRFFLNLFNLTGSGSNPMSLEDVQVAPMSVGVGQQLANIKQESVLASQMARYNFAMDTLQGMKLAPVEKPFIQKENYLPVRRSDRKSNLWFLDVIPHGDMYIYNLGGGAVTVTVSVVDTFYQIGSGITGGICNGFTFQNAKELLCLTGGVYLVNLMMSVECAAANQEIECAVMKNGTANTSIAAHIETITANKPGTLAATGIMSLAPGDLVSASVLNHTGANNVTIDHLGLSIFRVG